MLTPELDDSTDVAVIAAAIRNRAIWIAPPTPVDSTIALAPVIVDHDEGRLTLPDVLRKRYYYGRSIPAFAEQHDGAVGAQGKAVLQSYLRHRTDLLKDPAHAAGMVVMRGMEVVGYSLGARRGRRDRAAQASS